MSSYLNFNNWAYQYYLDRNSIYNIGTLAIEVTEIENYCSEFNCNLKFREIISFDWSKLLQQNDNNKPQYFGLIALQCYAASKMQNEKGIANAADYRTRFMEVSGITTTQELEKKFKENFLDIPVQEQIWINAQKHLKSKNIDIIIPYQRTERDRYVQYPKKQVVLNQEDLKEYVSYFRLLQETFDIISFEEFKRHFKNYIYKYHFIRNNNTRTDRTDSETNIKLKQIFDFYCSENWQNIIVSNYQRIINITKNQYILLYEKTPIQKINLYDENSKVVTLTKSIFKKSPVENFLFFKKSSDYLNEYESINYLEKTTDYIIIVLSCPSINNEIRILKKCLNLIDYPNNNFLFFEGRINSEELPNILYPYIKYPYPIELFGVKISRKKEYLIDFPPTINNTKSVNYRIQPEYDCNNAKVGKYQVRVAGFSNLNFEIIENPKLNQLIPSRNMGLKIQDLSLVTNGFDVQGLEYFLKSAGENKCELNINNWIKVQTRKNKIKSSNIILKSINQSKNGR